MATAEVKLHGFWASPFSQRVIWALKLKGIDYEYIEEDLANKSELLLKYNPVHKKIPVLVHNGKAIAESLVILEYIEETWPHPPLLPHNAYDRAIARFWMKAVGEQDPNQPRFSVKPGEEKEEIEKRLQEYVKENTASRIETLKVLEEQGGVGVGGKKFFGGDTINLVDISCGWVAYWFPITEQVMGLTLLEPTSFPRLHEWAKNFKDVPVIKENLPDYAQLLSLTQRTKEKFMSTAN